MTIYADLEVALRRGDDHSYRADLRFTQAGGETEERLSKGPAKIALNLERLGSPMLDDDSYARELTSSFFQDTGLKDAFKLALSGTQAQGAALRIRLVVDFGAPELHGVCWELLQDPDTGSRLFTGEGILLSRYLSSSDWRPVTLRPKSDLKALVAIANPAKLDQYQLAPVDVPGELDRAQKSLTGIAIAALATPGSANPNDLAAKLRDGYDILYLVCHGALVDGQPWLFMEDDQGNIARVAGTDFVARLQELQQRPRLIVLASCQSAGDNSRHTGQTLAALGPLLAEAGIPAVLAMQGSVSMQTVANFMPVFFRELLRDGQIDRAMSVARGAVRDRPDCWMPVLFMRLRSGRIWYVPGFGSEQEEFQRWPALLSKIYRDPSDFDSRCKCTPILGSGLMDGLLGSTREIASRWAEDSNFPLAPFEREDLPNVAQYVAVTQDPDTARSKLRGYLAKQIRQRYPGAPAQATLDELFEFAGVQRLKEDPSEPHRLLAGLPFCIYITTNPDSLLESALRDVGKNPVPLICPWTDDLQDAPELYELLRDYEPDANHPLVYHLFGRMRKLKDEPESIVLTEDDYFDYLIGATRNKELIPKVLRQALVNTALLFLGFQLDDWNFRVLFRSIMSQEGRELRKKKEQRNANVAVQVDLEQGRFVNPEGARRYLEQYFGQSEISIYWGSAQDFIKELATKAKGEAARLAAGAVA